jgi:hypothetical protein
LAEPDTTTTSGRERPILFSGPMVRAILAGTKTQTRRVIAPVQPREDGRWPAGRDPLDDSPFRRGGTLWVRETWQWNTPPSGYIYRADDIAGHIDSGWRPSIFMPREACRLRLEVTDVRVQRLQDISEEDAEDEGVQPSEMALSPRAAFERLWDSINAKRAPWDSNPWVWCVSFVRSGSPLQKEPVMP